MPHSDEAATEIGCGLPEFLDGYWYVHAESTEIMTGLPTAHTGGDAT
jgi:hypothetical protein